MIQGAFTDFMDGLETLHNLVATELAPTLDVRVYRWRPVGMPELPAIYPWVNPSPYTVTATNGRVEFMARVAARVAAPHVDGVQDGRLLEEIIDTYLTVAGSNLMWPHLSPFDGVAQVVNITSAANVVDRFNDVPVLAMEFGLEAQLVRFLSPPS